MFYDRKSRNLIDFARMLRRYQTDAEALMWGLLRNRQINGLKFRRQHPIREGFVLDFYCHEIRLGIEIDGNIHEEKEQKRYDRLRTEALYEIYGIMIIRFSNDQVLNHPDKVITKVTWISEKLRKRIL